MGRRNPHRYRRRRGRYSRPPAASIAGSGIDARMSAVKHAEHGGPARRFEAGDNDDNHRGHSRADRPHLLRRSAAGGGALGEGGDPRHGRRDAGRRRRTVRPDRRARAGRGSRQQRRRRMPDLRHRPPRRAARRRADQRHGGARARFRRCQQFDGRAPVGADRAGAVRARRNPRLHRARFHRRLCRRVRDRDPHRPRRQSAPLRKGLAPDRDVGRVRRRGRLLSPDRPRPREDGAGAGDRGLARRPASRPISAR